MLELAEYNTWKSKRIFIGQDFLDLSDHQGKNTKFTGAHVSVIYRDFL